ncbi:MAG: hypothetical protein C4541_03465 [Candidatus Auribacter fodinae]|uniref:PEP-CTERM sorting domain-containing protein n=1 Tax=Candidatus Auribacter fodinae TaxID=2093366 RepID=A0A3A4R8N5_9BACT|nr:MAG: hypothetical protein C4541_03465 [Candidatus Auribacter fodinae]
MKYKGMKITLAGGLAVLLFSVSAYSATILGFTTNKTGPGSSYSITDIGGGLRQLEFGSLAVTQAKINNNSISELLGAEIDIDDVVIDSSTEMLLGALGPINLYSFDVTTGTLADGFKIKIGMNTVLEADLILDKLVAGGKSAFIDAGLTFDLTNVEIFTTGLDADTIMFLNAFLPGGDIVLSLASYLNYIDTSIRNGVVDKGPVSGIITPVPEPFSYFIMGWGALVLYSFKKMGFVVKR